MKSRVFYAKTIIATAAILLGDACSSKVSTIKHPLSEPIVTTMPMQKPPVSEYTLSSPRCEGPFLVFDYGTSRLVVSFGLNLPTPPAEKKQRGMPDAKPRSTITDEIKPRSRTEYKPWNASSIPSFKFNVGDTFPMETLGTFQREIIQSSLPTLLLFTAPWCVPCGFNESILATHAQNARSSSVKKILKIGRRFYSLNILEFDVTSLLKKGTTNRFFEEEISLPVTCLIDNKGKIVAIGRVVYDPKKQDNFDSGFLNQLDQITKSK